MDWTTSELPQNLTDKMDAAKRTCAERCPTCGVGRGRWCRDESGRNTAIHAARRI